MSCCPSLYQSGQAAQNMSRLERSESHMEDQSLDGFFKVDTVYTHVHTCTYMYTACTYIHTAQICSMYVCTCSVRNKEPVSDGQMS